MNMEGREIEIKEDALTNGLATTIKTFVCAVLPIGWSIDDGSRGTILLNVAEKKLKFEHEEYVTKDTTWEVEWDIPADEEGENDENEERDDATNAANGR